MTNYITSVGVQQFSITIASGSTTGTATITAVGSGSFMLYGGVNPSIAADAAEQFAKLTISGTTITATRNTGTAGTVVVNGCIIDGDTTNLIKSIQYGSVTVASGFLTGTASISAVTNNNTAIHYLGHTVADSGLTFSSDVYTVALSGTTVTAARQGAPALAATVQFVAIEFQGTALNQAVQNVSITLASTASNTATITSVVTNNALCIWGGFNSDETTSDGNTWSKGVLTSSTVVTATLNSSTAILSVFKCTVVEFVSGVLKSAVQRNTTTLTGATSNTTAITSVTLGNSGISWLGNTASAAASLVNESAGACALTNGTTVTVTKNNATANITGSWEVFEFPAFSSGSTVVFRITLSPVGTRAGSRQAA